MNRKHSLMRFISIITTLVLMMPFVQIDSSASYGYYYYKGSNSRVRDYICDCLFEMKDSIDVHNFNLKFDEMSEIYTDVILSNSELFYIKPEYQYSYDRKTQQIYEIYPAYFYSKSKIPQMSAELEEAADMIISEINNGWTAPEKALYVHDRIATMCVYDEKNETRSAYEVLIKGDALCVGYAMAFKYIMDRLGFDCIIVSSLEMVHTWNMLKIDGNWYHVDVTWDDPTPDLKGNSTHDYFLVSDEKIKEGRFPHYSWDSRGITAPSTKYDNAWWTGSGSAILQYGKYDKYYIDTKSGSLCRYSLGETETLDKIPLEWNYSRSQKWTKSFSRICELNGIIYYNSADTVYSFDPKTENIQKAASPKLTGTDCIFGMYVKNGSLYAEICTLGSNDPSPKYSRIDTSKPQCPENIRASIKGKSITVSWDKAANADGYTIYRYDKSKKKYIAVADVFSTKYVIKNNASGEYKFRIRSYKDSDGKKTYSSYSETIKVKVK